MWGGFDGRHMLLAPRVVVAFACLLIAGCAGAPLQTDDGQFSDSDEVDVTATETTGVIRGVVMDEALRPLQGATVTLQGGESTTTGEAGTFGFDGVEPGVSFVSISRRGYADTQQSVDVAAGVDEPPFVRILLRAIDVGTPYIDAFATKLLVGLRACVGGCGLGPAQTDNPGGLFGNGSRSVNVALSPNATIGQTEAHWDATTPLAENGVLPCSSRIGETQETVDYQANDGPTPLVTAVAASKDDLVGDTLGCSWLPQPGDIPVGLSYAQTVDTYTHVFYHFQPNAGWQFGRDGEHPVPPTCQPGDC